MASALKFALVLFAFVAIAQGGIVLVLDTFQGPQQLLRSFNSGNAPSGPPGFQEESVVTTADIVGGERDLLIDVTQADPGVTYVTTVFNGIWSIATPAEPPVMISTAFYQLDGPDGTAFSVDPSLNIDFTQSGSAFQLEVSATTDLETTYEFILFAAGDVSTTASIQLVIPDFTSNQPFVLPYSIWTADPGFNFANVGALQIQANIDELADIDSNISFLGLTVNEIDGVVFFDCDENGSINNGELGYPNVLVDLLDDLGNTVDTTTTDSLGEYTFFTGPGTYQVCVQPSSVSEFTVPSSGCTPLFTLVSGEDRFGDTFGCYVPVTIFIPPSDTIDCTDCTDPSSAPGCPGVASATACDNGVSITNFDSINTLCIGTFTITRTWTASFTTSLRVDTDTDTQTITVQDNTSPVFNFFPADFGVGCGQSISPAANGGAATATDDCSTPSVVYSDDAGAGCTEPVARTWTATDDCGNVVQDTQDITITDFDPPVFTFEPPNDFLECGQSTDPSNTGQATATDACNVGPTTVTFTDSNIIGSCPEQFTRLWTATDACNNVATYAQDISIDDTVAPSLSIPPTANVACGASTDPSQTGQATAADSCTTPFVTFDDLTSGNNCASGIQREWSASDDCNIVFGTQQINISDTTDPTFTSFPGPATVDCNDSTDPTNTGLPTATDDCSGIDIISFADSNIVGNSCFATFTRVWVATDGCGNDVSSVQSIATEDTTDPVVFVPADTVIDCDDPTSTGFTGDATATDDCSSVSVGSTIATISSTGCTTVYERTFTATDLCGFTDVDTQTITATDSSAPSFVGFPADTTVDCDSEFGANISPSITGEPGGVDNCTQFPFVTFTDVETNALCPNGIDVERTWTVSDNCGLSTTQVQQIDIVNPFPPVVTAPNNLSIDCSASTDPVNTGGSATVSGTCDPQLTVTFTDSISGTGCNQLISRTWSATNACGNFDTDVQTITLTDNVAPTMFPFPDDVSIGCEEGTDPLSTGMPTVSDNCDPTPSLTFSDSIVQPAPVEGVCPSPITITRTWFAADACNNDVSQNQVIVVSQEAPVECTPVECAPVACDTSDCPTSDCSCCSDEPRDCTPVDCLATPCAAVACDAVPCLNCPEGGSAGAAPCTPVGCEPITVYFDDDDYVNAGLFGLDTTFN